MKKILIWVLMLITCSSILSYAEEAESGIAQAKACTCCSCQNNGTSAQESNDSLGAADTPNVDEMSTSDKYQLWAEHAWLILHDIYAKSTWIYAPQTHDSHGNLSYLSVSFLLLDDVRKASEKQMGSMRLAIEESWDDEPQKSLINMHDFIIDTPERIELLLTERVLLVETVPDEYEYFDTTIMKLLELLSARRNKLVQHIEVHKSMEGFDTDTPKEIYQCVKTLEYMTAF